MYRQIRCSFIWMLLLFLNGGLSVATTLSPWDIFPKSQQGEHGVYLKAYNQTSGEVRDLTYLSDYSFGTPGANWNVPYIARYEQPWIMTHPGGLEFPSLEETWLIINFAHIASGKEVYIRSVAGSINPWDQGDVDFVIFASKWDGAAWKSWKLYEVNVTDTTITYSVSGPSESIQFLSFHVTPRGYSYNDTTFYCATIDYVPVPLPSTILLMGGALTVLPLLRKRT